MKSYNIEFRVVETQWYSASVDAETPEEALKKFTDDPSEPDWEAQTYDGSDTPTNVQVIGHWVPFGNNASQLERYDDPIEDAETKDKPPYECPCCNDKTPLYEVGNYCANCGEQTY